MTFNEQEFDGWFEVLSVEDCPPLAEGPGRVVTTTYTRMAGDMRRVTFAGDGADLVVTGPHRLYSETRDTWVAARYLQPGEVLRTQEGRARVLSNEAVSPRIIHDARAIDTRNGSLNP